jgi:hypothetical protein
MTIVSNFCEFDETGLIVGLKTPMIHMYNKVTLGTVLLLVMWKIFFLIG